MNILFPRYDYFNGFLLYDLLLCYFQNRWSKKELFQLNLINSSCFFKNQDYKSIDGYLTIKVNKDKHGLYKILSTELFSQERL